MKIIISEAYFRKGTKWRSLHANPLLCQPVPLPNIVTKFAYVIIYCYKYIYTLQSATYYFRAKSLEKSAASATRDPSSRFSHDCARFRISRRRRHVDNTCRTCAHTTTRVGTVEIRNYRRWRRRRRRACRDVSYYYRTTPSRWRYDATGQATRWGPYNTTRPRVRHDRISDVAGRLTSEIRNLYRGQPRPCF